MTNSTNPTAEYHEGQIALPKPPPSARERATAFILALPKFEGHQQAHPSNPEKSKLYRELIDKLEAEIRDFADWYHKAASPMPERRKPLHMLTEEEFTSPNFAKGFEWSDEEIEEIKAQEAARRHRLMQDALETQELHNKAINDFDVMPDDIRDQVAQEAKRRSKAIEHATFITGLVNDLCVKLGRNYVSPEELRKEYPQYAKYFSDDNFKPTILQRIKAFFGKG